MIQKIRSWMREKIKHANRRLLIAMACYLVLVGVALYVLMPLRTKYDRMLLGIVWAVFTILIIKTLIHAEDE
jgi:hypothetical protein